MIVPLPQAEPKDLTELLSIIHTKSFGPICIIGDLNGRHKTWDNEKMQEGDPSTNASIKKDGARLRCVGSLSALNAETSQWT